MERKSCDEACREGFTLIELLMVILIIGILVVMLLPVMYGVQVAVCGTRSQQRVTALEGHIRRYREAFGDYPASTPPGKGTDPSTWWQYPDFVDSRGQPFSIGNPGAPGDRVLGGGLLLYFLLGPEGQGWSPTDPNTAKRSSVAWEAPEDILEMIYTEAIKNKTVYFYYLQDGFGSKGSFGGTIQYARANPRSRPRFVEHDLRIAFSMSAWATGHIDRLLGQASQPFVLMSSGPDRLFGYYVRDGDKFTQDVATGICDDICNFPHD